MNIKYSIIKTNIIKRMLLLAVMLIGIISVPAIFKNKIYSAQYGPTIIGMYKSSDGYSQEDNLVKKHFEKHINKLGLSIRYHDFDIGFPEINKNDKVRAILTFYTGSACKSKRIAIDYISFLKKAADLGKRIIIVNSFGAYGYLEDGKEKWDLVTYYNPLFNKLGFNFKGFWTDDPKKLKILQRDKSIVDKGGKIDVKKAKYYQQIVPIDDSVKTHLTVKRIGKVNGLGDGKSSVIFTSKYGGFAMEQYVMQNWYLRIDPAKFLYQSLFYDDSYQNIGVIIGDIEKKDFIKNNIKYAFKYAKVKYSYIDISDLSNMTGHDLKPYEAIVIAANTVEKIPSKVMKDYLTFGGNVIFINYAELNDGFKKLLGLKYYGNSIISFERGYVEDPKFYMCSHKLRGKGFYVSTRRTKLSGAKPLIWIRKKPKNEYPLLWEKKVGKGKILYWNTNAVNAEKSFRGAILQSIHYCTRGFITGLANIGMMMIDDFPAPLWNMKYKTYRLKVYKDLLAKETDEVKREKIQGIIKRLKSKYNNQSDTDFIEKVWVKDMIKLEKKLKMPYSAFLIFNYNKRTTPKGDRFKVVDFYIANRRVPYKMGRLI